MVNGSDEIEGVRKLYKFSRLLLEADRPEALLDRLVDATRAITDADEVILFLLEGGEPKIHAVAVDSPTDDSKRDDELKYSETLVQKVIDDEQPLLLRDVSDDPKFRKAQSIQVLSITSAMGAPLYHDSELIGAIYAARRRVAQNFDDTHHELMTVAASQASLLLSRVASRKALRESTSRYRAVVEASPSAILMVRDNGVVGFANQKACEIWNRQSVAEIVGSQVRELFDPWRSLLLLDALADSDSFESIDAWVRCGPDQQNRPVEVVGRPVEFGGQCAMQLVVTETEERGELLQRRVHSDRVELMSALASKVGHEINNPLSYVHANIEFAIEELLLKRRRDRQGQPSEDEPDSYSEVLDGLRAARDGAERIGQIVDDLRNFSDLNGVSGDYESVERPLKSSLQVIRQREGDKIHWEVDIDSTSEVRLDAARLGQVFLNLLVNAVQALQKVDQPQSPRVSVSARDESDRVMVEIEDNGPGIDPEVQDRIFEPFVSTKGDSQSGLGLAICRELIEAAGGDVQVESAPGEGALFRLIFPPVDADEPQQQSDHSDHEPPGQRRSASILVVESEPILCRSLQRVLQDHEVTAVQTKGAAIDALREHNEFDVVLCDLSLRRGLGRDLFDWMQCNSPECWQKLVAMAPQKPNEEMRRYLSELPNPWIAKPFDLGELRAVIAEQIRRRRGE